MTAMPAAAPRRGHRVRYRLEYLAVRFAQVLVRVLPYRGVTLVGDILGRLFHRFDRRRRATALANVRMALPQRSEDECRVIVQRAFTNLGRHVLDVLRFDAMSVERVMEVVEFEGEQWVEQARAAGRGVMYFTGHFGSWELHLMAHAARFEPILTVARPLDNPLLETVIERLRNRAGTRVISRKGAIRGLLRGLLEHRSVGMMIDQHIEDRSAVTVDFFDRPASTTSSIAVLAMRAGVPIIPVFTRPLPGGRYLVTFEAPIDQPDPGHPDAARILTQRCTNVLETYVRRYPELWLWMHRRWRAPAAGASASDDSKTTVTQPENVVGAGH